MTTERKLTKARLIEIEWDDNNVATPVSSNDQRNTQDRGGQKNDSKDLDVQFNPASLKVTYSNQVQNGGDTSAALQFVGRGDSKLAVELVFDVSGKDATDSQDVRKMTERVAYFMSPQETDEDPPSAGSSNSNSPSSGDGEEDQTRYKVPGLRFQWGSFLFDGVMVSMDETLELWSEDGRPLRATVAINLTQPGIHCQFCENSNATPSPSKGKPTGTTPMTPIPTGASLQGLVADARITADWKAVAAANGIENPRDLTAGGLVNLRSRTSAGTSAGVGLQAGASLKASSGGTSASVRLS